jgi:hypothetical protein
MTENRLSRRKFLLGSAGLAAGTLLPPPRTARASRLIDDVDHLVVLSALVARRVGATALRRHGHRPGVCELCDDLRLVKFHAGIWFAMCESSTPIPALEEIERLVAVPLRGPRPDRAWPGDPDTLLGKSRMSAETCKYYRLSLTALAGLCIALRLSDDRCYDCDGCDRCSDSFPQWLTTRVLYDGLICGSDPVSIDLSCLAFGCDPRSLRDDPRDADLSVDAVEAVLIRTGREALA